MRSLRPERYQTPFHSFQVIGIFFATCMRSCWCLLGRRWLSSRLICYRRLRPFCLVLISDTVVRDVCSIDQSISTRGKVVVFANNIVFRRVVYRKALLLEVVSHECGSLACCQCERATIGLWFKYALCREHIAHTSSQFRNSSMTDLLSGRKEPWLGGGD